MQRHRHTQAGTVTGAQDHLPQSYAHCAQRASPPPLGCVASALQPQVRQQAPNSMKTRNVLSIRVLLRRTKEGSEPDIVRGGAHRPQLREHRRVPKQHTGMYQAMKDKVQYGLNSSAAARAKWVV